MRVAATEHSSRPGLSTAAGQHRGLASARYYVCVAILAASVVGMPLLEDALGAYFRKDEVPLKRHLRALDRDKLAPEYRPHPLPPGRLDEEIVQALGTEEYLQLRLIPRSDPTLLANVFITYYTGQPDMVPHVPEECYLAGGYDPVGQREAVEVYVPSVGAPHDRVPVRVLEFQARQGQARPVVLYFFHANGVYETTRFGVRVRLGNPLERYAYYAKIEVNFIRESSDRRSSRHLDRQESIEAIGPLLRKLLPILLEDHLDWEGVAGGPGRAEKP